MDSYYASNYKTTDKDDKSRSSKLMDSGELNKSSKHIDSGVCVESLSSVSSILTSSSSVSSNYSSSRKSTNDKHNSSPNSKNDSLNSSNKFETKKRDLFESAELNELYEYDYDEKEDQTDEEYDYDEKSTNFNLVEGQELINENYLLSNADLQDKDGNTMLHLAIIEHKTQLAYQIISIFTHPDYLDIRNKWSQTALHLACLTSQTKTVRRLVVSGATINLIDCRGDTAVHLACKIGDLNIVKQFFQPITKIETITANLSYNVTANNLYFKKFILNEKNFEGENCIFLAAQSGNFELIKYLVNEGAQINSQELKEGNTVLHLAVRLKSVDLIEFLIKTCGAHINQVNYANQTPLNLAWHMLNKNPNSKRIKIMIHLLKSNGGEPNDYYSNSSDEYDSSSSGELSD